VQGVGFRPCVYRCATALGLAGSVRNTPQGVLIEVEGAASDVELFREKLAKEKPPRAVVQGSEAWLLEPRGLAGFAIVESAGAGERSPFVLPDIAPCEDCLREMLDPSDRRHRYPFTNCTNCGPRFTIVEALPYDRANTTMRGFAMCPACLTEYGDPANRRFHAQPNACPACGPKLALRDRAGKRVAERDAALLAAGEAVRGGGIVALKGVGGFHLVCDARNEEAVRRLRERKRREEKPFAVMVADLASARALCEVSAEEARLLASAEAPIVLLRRRPFPVADCQLPVEREREARTRAKLVREGGKSACAPPPIGNRHSAIGNGIAPGNPRLGLLLPSSPLHHLLCCDLGFPIVATSGNLSDEPVCTDEAEALARLGGIADLFLVHDRPIARHADDSIVRVVDGREVVLRRARGYAPMPLPTPPCAAPTLGVGAHLKNAICLSRGGETVVSQHLGDMDTPESRAAFERAVKDVQALHGVRAARVACDLHPDYATTAFAKSLGLPVAGVQHHLAHAMACLAENEVEGPALAVAWDGTGYGTDGEAWGGEFLRVDGSRWERVAHLRRFRLPGGDAAAREPRRSALGLLAEIGAKSAVVEGAYTGEELRVVAAMLERGVNSPWTTSAGRLFDAVAAILGLRQRHAFEAQAAMELEWAAEQAEQVQPYPIRLAPVGQARRLPRIGDGSRSGCPTVQSGSGPSWVLDWQPTVEAILADLAKGRPVPEIALAFHEALAAGVVAVARQVGEKRVALAGGCFQNGVLLSRCIRALATEGFQPLIHQRLPPNDGSIAYGQAVAAARGMAEKPELRISESEGALEGEGRKESGRNC
jgi:hydrogenase maturation protein HypF